MNNDAAMMSDEMARLDDSILRCVGNITQTTLALNITTYSSETTKFDRTMPWVTH